MGAKDRSSSVLLTDLLEVLRAPNPHYRPSKIRAFVNT
jgi:hypothetical protein